MYFFQNFSELSLVLSIYFGIIFKTSTYFTRKAGLEIKFLVLGQFDTYLFSSVSFICRNKDGAKDLSTLIFKKKTKIY